MAPGLDTPAAAGFPAPDVVANPAAPGAAARFGKGAAMELIFHRFHFAFTITYHYLFPQLTMGLALLIVILKAMALRTGQAHWDRSARFWAKIFAVSFVMGVVTGVPMEFQFGTNWARFSEATGGVIGQALAMEGVFAFFLESTFLGLFLFGEKRLGPKLHFVSAVAVWLGSWLSGYFIVVTNAWMQNPVAFRLGPEGKILLTSWWALMTNPWVLWQYTHTMIGAVVTGAFVMAAIGAYYLLVDRFTEYGRTFVKVGVLVGLPAALLMLFPTGDGQALNVAREQPAALAAMEGRFTTERGAPLSLFGQPDTEKRRLDNPIEIPGMLSFLAHRSFDAEVKGLEAFPEEDWPDNVPLLYYSFHIMISLGMIFIAVMLLAGFLLWKGRLFTTRPVLWMLMLLAPFPFVANTFGWLTAELGRQPWLVYGLLRTEAGYSQVVSAGNTIFTLLGFMGMYTVLSILFLFLVRREIEHGPEPDATAAPPSPATPAAPADRP
jgi:cytochrome d ubiquinol oxidase subunit I